MTWNLDSLQDAHAGKIPLLDAQEDTIPATFEQWVEIHGEPAYVTDPRPRRTLDIDVQDCCPLEQEIDTSGIVTTTEKGDRKIDYARFLDVFVELNPLVYHNGVFYTPQGAISKDILKQDIHYTLKDGGWKGKLDAPVNSILESLKNHCAAEKLRVGSGIIPLANGDLHLNESKWVFRLDEFEHCPYRLSVRYLPQDKPSPLFDKWLRDVFMPEDIPSVQEIFGYCLVPVTSAEEAFIFVGDGGAGKSGVGAILKGLLGNAFLPMETQQLVTARFQVASVENKLVAYDDDLGSAALTETGLLKKLVSADVPIGAEKKYADPHEFNSYCRIVASANFMLSSLYDDSDGFYRRLHPILVKPKDPNRRDIRGFYEMILAEETEQILRWALKGLRRLIDNDWSISWSDRSRRYIEAAKGSAVHFKDFLLETCDFGQGDASVAEIKRTYKNWCRENGITPSSDRRLEKWLVDHAEKLQMRPSRTIKRGGKQVRGYRQVSIKPEWDQSRIAI